MLGYKREGRQLLTKSSPLIRNDVALGGRSIGKPVFEPDLKRVGHVNIYEMVVMTDRMEWSLTLVKSIDAVHFFYHKNCNSRLTTCNFAEL